MSSERSRVETADQSGSTPKKPRKGETTTSSILSEIWIL